MAAQTDQGPLNTVLLSDYSTSVTGTAVLAIGPEVLPDDTLMLNIYNNSASGTLWASHTGTATVGGAGSFAIGPSMSKLYTNPVPINQLSLIASTGTIVATVQAGVRVN